MLQVSPDIGIGILVVLPGIWLLWYANGHPEFYREKRWEKWHGRAALLGMLFSLVSRFGGTEGVKLAFRIFAIFCIAVGIWAIAVT